MRIPARLALSTLALLTLGSAALAQETAVEGQVGVNYTYNFNQPHTRSNTYIFNGSDAEFRLNHAEIKVSRQATERNRTGFVLRLFDGDVRNYFESMDTFVNSNVLEAFATQLSEFHDRNVRIDAGQFLTTVGIEGVTFGHFLSRSFNFQFLEPRIAQGVRASMEFNEDSSLTGSLQNRFSGVESGNKDLTVGLQYRRRLSEMSEFKVNLMAGRENMDGSTGSNTGGNNSRLTGGVNRETALANVVYHRMVGEETHFAIDASLRTGKDASNRRYDASGVTGYLSRGNVSVRGEYLSQSNATSGILPSLPTNASRKPTLASITLAYTIPTASKNAHTVLEYRYDRAADLFFAAEQTGNLKRDQSSLSIGQVVRF